MKQLFDLTSDELAETMLSMIQAIQRTDILDEGETQNYITILKSIFP